MKEMSQKFGFAAETIGSACKPWLNLAARYGICISFAMKKAVIADFLKSLGEDILEEAAQEFEDIKNHDFVFA